MFTNVYTTARWERGDVSHFLRCAAPSFALLNHDSSRLRELGDGAPEVLGVQVQIDLRRVQAAMTEQALNVPDAGAVTQQVSRARVTEGVDVGFYLRCSGISFDALLDHHVREFMSGARQPQSG